MRGSRRSRPSPALVVAVLALVAGVTGVAVAQPAGKKPVTKKKVVKIADKEINKLAPQLSVANAADAETLNGVAPSGFVSSDIVTRFKSETVDPGQGGDIDAGCNAGEQILGGGGRMAGVFASEDVTLVSSRPNTFQNGGAFTQWHASGRNGEAQGKTLTAYAVCAR